MLYNIYSIVLISKTQEKEVQASTAYASLRLDKWEDMAEGSA